MKKHLILFPILFIAGIFFSSCDTTSTTEPTPVTPTGSLNIQSTPQGAEIWLDGDNTGQVTNAVIQNVDVGSHTVTLILDGYRDTTVTVTVEEDLETVKFVALESDLSLTKYGPVRIYETSGTTAEQPSGLDLSSGNAYGVSGSDKGSVDIYYTSNGYLVQSANLNTTNNLTRETSFYVGDGTNLDDEADSPLATNSWTQSMGDREANYVFLFDNDLHYSKIKITGSGGGSGPGDPAYVDLEWYYNNKENDNRF